MKKGFYYLLLILILFLTSLLADRVIVVNDSQKIIYKTVNPEKIPEFIKKTIPYSSYYVKYYTTYDKITRLEFMLDARQHTYTFSDFNSFWQRCAIYKNDVKKMIKSFVYLYYLKKLEFNKYTQSEDFIEKIVFGKLNLTYDKNSNLYKCKIIMDLGNRNDRVVVFARKGMILNIKVKKNFAAEDTLSVKQKK